MFSVIIAIFSALVVAAQSQNFHGGSQFDSGNPSIDSGLVQNVQQPQRSMISDDQTFVPPCGNVRANIRNAHPFDQTKYYICRNKFNYEIITCPNGGLFDDSIKGCIDLCEQKKPCLNGGQCIILSNLTLQCVCRRDWTGDRCEKPLSTCAANPCGSNADCQMLKASDYTQDYVCICGNEQRYGRNCQQTMPNPCLTNNVQFHPFAYSRRAYINCDGERIFFQPCPGFHYWNQEEKRCDRLLPELFRLPQLVQIINREKARKNSGAFQNSRQNTDETLGETWDSLEFRGRIPQQQQPSLHAQSWQSSFANQQNQNQWINPSERSAQFSGEDLARHKS